MNIFQFYYHIILLFYILFNSLYYSIGTGDLNDDIQIAILYFIKIIMILPPKYYYIIHFGNPFFYEWSFEHFSLMLPRPIHTKLQRIYVQKTLFDYYYKWCVIFQTSLASNLVPYLLMLK